MEMEHKKTNRIFKPPQIEDFGTISSSKDDELPSVKIARLKKELEEIQ
jgi:hypothetical protein